MQNNYAKIQEKIKKDVVKHFNSKVRDTHERSTILYGEYNDYVLMTAFNHQEYFIPKNEVDNSTVRIYGREDIDSMVALTDRVLEQATCVLKYLGVYKGYKEEFVLFEGENDNDNDSYIVAFNKKFIAAIKYDVVYGSDSKQPALFYNEGIPVLLQAPCVLSVETLHEIGEELKHLNAIKHFKIKL